MLVYVPAAAAIAALVSVASVRLKRRRNQWSKLRCCVDPLTPQDAEFLLRLVTNKNDSADRIAEKLVRLFSIFTPRESSLQSMSMCVDTPHSIGGTRDFAVCTVYGSMTSALMSSDVTSSNAVKKSTSFPRYAPPDTSRSCL